MIRKVIPGEFRGFGHVCEQSRDLLVRVLVEAKMDLT